MAVKRLADCVISGMFLHANLLGKQMNPSCLDVQALKI